MSIGLSDAALAPHLLFRGMSAGERQELLGMFETKTFEPGAMILAEEESYQILWIVLQGTCRVVKKTKSGEDRELTTIEASGVFGEMSFFEDAPHSASVYAVTEVELAGISRAKYDVLTRVGSSAAHKLAFNTISVLIQRVRKMDAFIGHLLDQTAAKTHHEEWKDFQAKLYTGWTF
jgi:CRP/FNR family cyclic AMP-dependent transcriptional regulator